MGRQKGKTDFLSSIKREETQQGMLDVLVAYDRTEKTISRPTLNERQMLLELEARGLHRSISVIRDNFLKLRQQGLVIKVPGGWKAPKKLRASDISDSSEMGKHIEYHSIVSELNRRYY